MFLLWGIASCWLIPATASATELPSSIKENMTLSASGGPYLGGSITIESGVTLTIEPGVVLKVSGFIVKGTLKAEGSAEEPIVFTGSSESSPGEWSNIKFEP